MNDFSIGKRKAYVIILDGWEPLYWSWFEKNVSVVAFIDDEFMPHGGKIHGKPVLTRTEYFSKIHSDEYGIIIGNGHRERAIALQLEKYGFIRNQDFCFYRDFQYLYEFYHTGRCEVFYTEMILTTYCNLHCKDCTYQIPYRTNHLHRPYKEIINDINLYFSVVDRVQSFRLLGGEPLLHPKFYEILKYVVENYSNKIDGLYIVTNGMMLLSAKLLETVSIGDVTIVISDYSKGFPSVHDKVSALENQLVSNHINYKVMSGEWWNDTGDCSYRNALPQDELKKMFKKCEASCVVLHNEGLFYCGKSIMRLEEGIMDEEELTKDEYCSLNRKNKKELKKQVIDFCAGNQQDAYLSACKYCKGYFGPNVGERILSGVQIQDVELHQDK